MTRLKFDVEGVDPGGDFAVPKPGAYQCKIDVIEPKESNAGNEMLEVQYVITEKGEFQNSRLWDYIVLTENQKWKYRRFLEAVGAVTGRKEKGEIDIDKLIGKRVLVKITNEDSEEYGKRARVGSVSKLKSADVEDDDGEDEDEDGEDEGEDLTYEDVQAMTKKELKELIDELVEEEEIERIRVTKQTKLNTLRDKVCEALELEEEEDEPEDEDEDEVEDGEEAEGEDEEELSADDITSMNKTELKELIEEEELSIRVTKQTKLPALRKRVVAKAIEEGLIVDPDEEGEDEDEDDDVEEVEDYAELGVADLRNECKERGLNSKGSKSALVKRLEKDDEETGAL